MYSLNNIGFLEITDERARVAKQTSDIHYLEFGITSRCNFSCPYCNLIKTNDMSKENVFLLVDYLKEQNLQFIQFTGGEPLCRKDLEEIISYCKSLNIRCGVSTNGSFPINRYKKLIELGVELFSISFDHLNQEDAKTVVENIKELSKLVYVNIGTVIDKSNHHCIENIIDDVVSWGVSDIKLSTDSHLNLIPPKISKFYGLSILDYRIKRFNNQNDMRGLDKRVSKCFLIGNDLSIIGNNHYPCLVYAREKGKPIGAIFHNGKLNKKIKEERIEFMNKHKPNEDALCKKYCMDFKCDFNLRCLNEK
jgi:MoaA/NifB/PqqE/SkfB family radical SAM enzyme